MMSLPYMSLKNKPKPVTRNAWLISAGIPTPTYTKHFYKETVRAGDAYKHMFTCIQTGKDRLWGLDDALAPETN